MKMANTLAVAFTVAICTPYLVGCMVETDNDEASVPEDHPCETELALEVVCSEGFSLYCNDLVKATVPSDGTVNGICGEAGGFCFTVVVRGPAVLTALNKLTGEGAQLLFEVMDDASTPGDEHISPTLTSAFEVSAPAEILITVP